MLWGQTAGGIRKLRSVQIKVDAKRRITEHRESVGATGGHFPWQASVFYNWTPPRHTEAQTWQVTKLLWVNQVNRILLSYARRASKTTQWLVPIKGHSSKDCGVWHGTTQHCGEVTRTFGYTSVYCHWCHQFPFSFQKHGSKFPLEVCTDSHTACFNKSPTDVLKETYNLRDTFVCILKIYKRCTKISRTSHFHWYSSIGKSNGMWPVTFHTIKRTSGRLAV